MEHKPLYFFNIKLYGGLRKILFILFLFPMAVLSQPTFIEKVEAFNTAGVPSSSGGLTMLAGKLYIVFLSASNASGTPATCTSVTGTDQTWTEIGTAGGVVQTTSGKRLQAFRFAPTSTNTNTINYNWTGTSDGGWVVCYEVSGCDVTGTNGSNAIIQVVTATDNATQHPSITMAALQSRSSVLTAWVNDVNPPGGTPEAGWTSTTDNGYATPDTGGYTLYRENTSDNTPSWTAAAFSNWAGMAIEIKAGNRRIFNTN